jgi:hypothetical protein
MSPFPTEPSTVAAGSAADDGGDHEFARGGEGHQLAKRRRRRQKNTCGSGCYGSGVLSGDAGLGFGEVHDRPAYEIWGARHASGARQGRGWAGFVALAASPRPGDGKASQRRP